MGDMGSEPQACSAQLENPASLHPHTSLYLSCLPSTHYDLSCAFPYCYKAFETLPLHLRPHISPTAIFIPFPCYEYLHSSNPFYEVQGILQWASYIRLAQREGGHLHLASPFWHFLIHLPPSTWRPSKNPVTLSVKKEAVVSKGGVEAEWERTNSPGIHMPFRLS